MFRRILLFLIDFYRKGISPFTPPSCRFVPSCSTYAYEAVERFGPLRGGWLFVKRFARCNPWGGSGVDPVPGVHGSKLATSRAPACGGPSDGTCEGVGSR